MNRRLRVEHVFFRARSISSVEKRDREPVIETSRRRGSGGYTLDSRFRAFTPNCSPTKQSVRRTKGEGQWPVFFSSYARSPNERLHASTEQRQLPARGRGWWLQAAATRNPRAGSRFRWRTPRQDPRGVGASVDPATPAERHHLQSNGDLPDGDRGTGPKTFSEIHLGLAGRMDSMGSLRQSRWCRRWCRFSVSSIKTMASLSLPSNALQEYYSRIHGSFYLSNDKFDVFFWGILDRCV